jgi:hypothetical protein
MTKHCVNCQHYKLILPKSKKLKWYEVFSPPSLLLRPVPMVGHYCFAEKSLVTGNHLPQPCERMRAYQCGVKAKLFKPKQEAGK